MGFHRATTSKPRGTKVQFLHKPLGETEVANGGAYRFHPPYDITDPADDECQRHRTVDPVVAGSIPVGLALKLVPTVLRWSWATGLLIRCAALLFASVNAAEMP